MSDESETEQMSEMEEERRRTKRIVRRLGYVVFIGGGLAVFIAMLAGVVRGIQTEDVRDPYTGLPRGEADCVASARELMFAASSLEDPTGRWSDSYERWVAHCKGHYPEIHDLLRDTRGHLRAEAAGDGEPSGGE